MKKINGLPYKLKRQLLLNFLMIIVLMAVMNIASVFWTATYYHQLSGKLENQVELHKVSINFLTLLETLSNYISSGNSNYKEDVTEILGNVAADI